VAASIRSVPADFDDHPEPGSGHGDGAGWRPHREPLHDASASDHGHHVPKKKHLLRRIAVAGALVIAALSIAHPSLPGSGGNPGNIPGGWDHGPSPPAALVLNQVTPGPVMLENGISTETVRFRNQNISSDTEADVSGLVFPDFDHNNGKTVAHIEKVTDNNTTTGPQVIQQGDRVDLLDLHAGQEVDFTVTYDDTTPDAQHVDGMMLTTLSDGTNVDVTPKGGVQWTVPRELG
jgi:hypothetical protein